MRVKLNWAWCVYSFLLSSSHGWATVAMSEAYFGEKTGRGGDSRSPTAAGEGEIHGVREEGEGKLEEEQRGEEEQKEGD